MSPLHELAKQIFHSYILDNDEMDLLREAGRLMQPIGSCPDDERTLVTALAHARSSGQPDSSALWNLHGVNSHAQNIWTDYYDLNRDRVEELVEELVDAFQVEGYLSASTLDDARSDDALAQSSSQTITRAGTSEGEGEIDLSAVPQVRSEFGDRGESTGSLLSPSHEVAVETYLVGAGVVPASTTVDTTPQAHTEPASKNEIMDTGYKATSAGDPSLSDIGLRRGSRLRRPTKRSDDVVIKSASALYTDSLPTKTADRSTPRAQSSRRPRRMAKAAAGRAGRAVTLRDLEACARFLAEHPDTLAELRDGRGRPHGLPQQTWKLWTQMFDRYESTIVTLAEEYRASV